MKVGSLRSTSLCITLLLISSSLIPTVSAWGNGGFSQDPSNPNYGTHDWISEHALDWLPEEEKRYLLENLAAYLYGTELPDRSQAEDGIGDTSLHHIYFNFTGALVDDSAAIRAAAMYNLSLEYLRSGNLAMAAKYAGATTHYIADVAVFGHVMGARTDWGSEQHHTDYESYVNERTSSYKAEFDIFLSFDGKLDIISAYEAAVRLANDTTFDVDGDFTCLWMDQNYNWKDPNFRNRVGESINLAVNLIADVLHTLYIESSSPPMASVNNFKLSDLVISPAEIGIGEVVNISVTVKNVGYVKDTCTVVLKINGTVEASKDATLASGESTVVVFRVSRDDVGLYEVEVNGLRESFMVKDHLLRPAEFRITELSINPTKVQPGEIVTITLKVTNIGEETGSYTVELKIAGETTDSKTVMLAGGESTSIAFGVIKEVSGIYNVEVGGQIGTFVVEKPAPLSPMGVFLPYIGAAILGIAILIIVSLTRRRK